MYRARDQYRVRNMLSGEFHVKVTTSKGISKLFHVTTLARALSVVTQEVEAAGTLPLYLERLHVLFLSDETNCQLPFQTIERVETQLEALRIADLHD